MKLRDGDALKLIRKINNWTLSDLSSRTGLSESHLSKIETRRRKLVGTARYILEYDLLLVNQWWNVMIELIDSIQDEPKRSIIKRTFIDATTGGKHE